MKLFYQLAFAISISFVAPSSFASSFPLGADDTSMVALTQASSINPIPQVNCPMGATCAQISGVRLQFEFASCVSRLGPVSYIAVNNAANGKVDIYISAYEIMNKNAPVVFCSGPSIATTDIILRGRNVTPSDVNLIFLQ